MAAFSGWAAKLLHALGAPVTAENMRALIAWQRAEGGSARFNPLNTTQPARGASNYNGVGVKSFTSADQGLHATVQTLLNGHYGNIVGLLRSGKATAAQIGTAVEHSPWGTGGGVLRVLGSKPVPIPESIPHGSTPPLEGAGSRNLGLARQLVAGYLLQSAQAQLHGQQTDPSQLAALAIARKQLMAAQPAGGSHAAAPAYRGSGGSVQYVGDLRGLDAGFLGKLSHAVSAIGGTKVKVTSGYRSPEHNAAVGGVPHSNHTTGHAMDGEVFIPGRGWVPLGVALKGVAPKFGLRSGDQPGFYHGGVDTVHVDDGFNLRH